MDNRSRNLFFWFVMLFLAVVIWKVVQVPEDTRQLTYTELLNEIEHGNVLRAVIAVSQDSAEVRGVLRKPEVRFHVIVAKEIIPDLSRRLQDKSAQIEFVAAPRSDWMTLFVNGIPLLLIVGLWVYMIRSMAARKKASQRGDSLE